MSKIDEMDIKISEKSANIGYSVVVLLLGIWMIYELIILLVYMDVTQYNPIPTIICTSGMSAQFISNIYIKRKMTAGDEHKEPMNINDKLTIIFCVFWIIVNISEIVKMISKLF